MIVLHSHDIRKAHGPFKVLVNASLREQFMQVLESALTDIPLTLIAAVIDKKQLCERCPSPRNPYEIALRFCLERTYAFLKDNRSENVQTTIVVECRGAVEDNALELAFRRIVQGDNRWGPLPLDIVFADKKANSTGLQIADLVLHPIGRHHVKPEQPNRAFDVIRQKLRKSPTGEEKGWGLKTFP